jgi:hypothetical protein
MDGTFSIFLSAAGSTAGLRGVRRATNFFEGAKRVRVVTAIQVGREMVIARFVAGIHACRRQAFASWSKKGPLNPLRIS